MNKPLSETLLEAILTKPVPSAKEGKTPAPLSSDDGFDTTITPYVNQETLKPRPTVAGAQMDWGGEPAVEAAAGREVTIVPPERGNGGYSDNDLGLD